MKAFLKIVGAICLTFCVYSFNQLAKDPQSPQLIMLLASIMLSAFLAIVAFFVSGEINN